MNTSTAAPAIDLTTTELAKNAALGAALYVGFSVADKAAQKVKKALAARRERKSITDETTEE